MVFNAFAQFHEPRLNLENRDVVPRLVEKQACVAFYYKVQEGVEADQNALPMRQLVESDREIGLRTGFRNVKPCLQAPEISPLGPEIQCPKPWKNLTRPPRFEFQPEPVARTEIHIQFEGLLP
jgi:hypothetical protein